MSQKSPETTDIVNDFFGSIDDLMDWCNKVVGLEQINSHSFYVSALLLAWFGLSISDLRLIGREDVSFDGQFMMIAYTDSDGVQRKLVIRNPRVCDYLKKYYDSPSYVTGRGDQQPYVGTSFIRTGTESRLTQTTYFNGRKRLREIALQKGYQKTFSIPNVSQSGRFAKLYAYVEHYHFPVRPNPPRGEDYLIYVQLSQRVYGGSTDQAYLQRRWKIFYLWCKQYREVTA